MHPGRRPLLDAQVISLSRCNGEKFAENNNGRQQILIGDDVVSFDIFLNYFFLGRHVLMSWHGRLLHCFCVMASVKKVIRAVMEKTPKSKPTQIKSLRPLSHVRQ